MSAAPHAPSSILLFLIIGPFLMSFSRANSGQTVHTVERILTRTVGYKYLLALPSDYRAKAPDRWPILLFLHGSGERGDDVWGAAKHGPPKLLHGKELLASERTAADLLARNFIVVSPQCPPNKWWDAEAVLAVLDEVLTTHSADRDRIYLTGMSMGGYGTWTLGMAHPDLFAAIAPICGGGEFATPFMSSIHKRSHLQSLGVWAFHGANDTAVPVTESQRMIEMLEHMGSRNAKLTIYPDALHDSWTETYANPELYKWFLRHRQSGGRIEEK
jgi:predicted peptidase